MTFLYAVAGWRRGESLPGAGASAAATTWTTLRPAARRFASAVARCWRRMPSYQRWNTLSLLEEPGVATFKFAALPCPAVTPESRIFVVVSRCVDPTPLVSRSSIVGKFVSSTSTRPYGGTVGAYGLSRESREVRGSLRTTHRRLKHSFPQVLTPVTVPVRVRRLQSRTARS